MIGDSRSKLLGAGCSSYRHEPWPDRNIAVREELMKLAGKGVHEMQGS
jgi:hypothetical protein